MELYNVVAILVFVNFLLIMGASIMALISNKRRLARELEKMEHGEIE